FLNEADRVLQFIPVLCGSAFEEIQAIRRKDHTDYDFQFVITNKYQNISLKQWLIEILMSQTSIDVVSLSHWLLKTQVGKYLCSRFAQQPGVMKTENSDTHLFVFLDQVKQPIGQQVFPQCYGRCD
ncbi:unnamed protein product, partial [Didymodactylos carnosus]